MYQTHHYKSTQHYQSRSPTMPYDGYPDNPLAVSRNFLLPFPNFSEHSSPLVNFRNSGGSVPEIHQPRPNSQLQFLKRSKQSCHRELKGKKRTNWIRAGTKAQQNQALLDKYDLFQWPTSYYDLPIHIHHRTPINVLYSLITEMNKIHLFTIDTESDPSFQRNSQPIPSLIQIQAIHNEKFATVMLIEVQHLPDQSTTSFRLIQQLCQCIFSPDNKILAWGEVISELTPFKIFELFDITRITNPFNMQKHFKQEWNKTHPHTPECRYHNSTNPEDDYDDVLICLVNADDIDNDVQPIDCHSDLTTCICPDNIRPYKNPSSQWSLQKAVKFFSQKALDKSFTLNRWSCGLDITLYTWRTNRDKAIRKSLISYAINDLFAPTQLYFNLNQIDYTNPIPIENTLLNSITRIENNGLPTFLLLSDSHCKNLSSVIDTPRYQLKICAISGLQWNNPYNRDLCAGNILESTSISSTLSTTTAIILLIGTNSIRCIPSWQIIEQIEDLVNKIHINHTHLANKHGINIILTFPCNKTSSKYQTIEDLHYNLNNYNHFLKLLAERINFSVVDFNIGQEDLCIDQMHLNDEGQKKLLQQIVLLGDTLVPDKVKVPQSQHRSRAAISRRNKIRHNKVLVKRKTNTLTRAIHISWKLPYVKKFLKEHKIKFARLPNIYDHKLRIQFDNEHDLQDAETLLSSTVFQEQCYMI